MDAKALVLVCLVFPGCGGASPDPEAPTSATTETPTEEQRITTLVFESQIAGYVHHDLDAYLASWTDDATMRIGRTSIPSQYPSQQEGETEEPGEDASRPAEAPAHEDDVLAQARTIGEHTGLRLILEPPDIELDRAGIEASRRMRWYGPPPQGVSLAHDNYDVDIDGDEAVLRCDSLVGSEGLVQVFREVYRLRRTEAGWRIFANRSWPIERRTGEQTVVIDGAYWAQRDAQARQADSQGHSMETIVQLVAAFRFRLAHQRAQGLAAAADAGVEAHMVLGRLAEMLGLRAEAERAYQRAHELEPQVEIPGWVSP